MKLITTFTLELHKDDSNTLCALVVVCSKCNERIETDNFKDLGIGVLVHIARCKGGF